MKLVQQKRAEAATCDSKTAKYSNIQAHHILSQLPLSHWVQSVRRVAFSFLSSVASLLISRATTEKSAFLFQRLSVLIQWYNAILLHDCFVEEEEKDE